MSGEPWQLGYPIPQANDPTFEIVGRKVDAENALSDHHRRERDDRMRRRVDEADKQDITRDIA